MAARGGRPNRVVYTWRRIRTTISTNSYHNHLGPGPIRIPMPRFKLTGSNNHAGRSLPCLRSSIAGPNITFTHRCRRGHPQLRRNLPPRGTQAEQGRRGRGRRNCSGLYAGIPANRNAGTSRPMRGRRGRHEGSPGAWPRTRRGGPQWGNLGKSAKRPWLCVLCALRGCCGPRKCVRGGGTVFRRRCLDQLR